VRVLLPLSLVLASCAKVLPAAPAPIELSTIEVNKPPLDDRSYRMVELDNGLRAVLISDADTDMAAAALDVHVGQFTDPADREGLAHFLEHMLFMGTEKYPDVDGYRDFVQSHGGGTNAGTSQEHTRYHFDIEHGYLEEALDRFAQFFIAPTLDPEYVQREREAVNSEYELKIQDEARRFREVRRETSNPEHGFAKFSVGDLETLADREERPVWDDLRAFYAEQYSASRMVVSVLGREDLDTLEAWVRARFEQVPTTGEGAPVQTVPAYRDDQLGVRINVIPVADERYVQVELPVPSATPHFREHPAGLLTHLIGQEGEGSPHSVLSSKGWITSLSASLGGTEDHGIVTVRLALTEAGFANVDDAVGILFQYFRVLQGAEDLSPWWEEERALSALNFAFAESPRATSAVQSAALRMQLYPPEHVLDAWATWSEYDAPLVDSYLSKLEPENLRLFVAGPGLETDQVEPRYDVPWGMQPLDAAAMKAWSTDPIHPGLRLPDTNPYVAEDTSLQALEGEVGIPTQIVDEDGLTVWHLLDPTFEVPRSTSAAQLVLPSATRGLPDRVNALLFSDLVDDVLAPMRDQLSSAGLRPSFGPDSMGMRLTVRGYDDKHEAVMAAYAEAIAGYEVDPARFMVLRDKRVQDWRNFTKQRSVNQVSMAVGESVDPAAWSFTDAADHLEQLTPEGLQSWLDGLFASLTIQAMVHGNHTAAEAEAIARAVAQRFPDATPAALPPVQTRKYPDGETVFRDVVVEHSDSAIRVQYQADDPSRATQSKWLILGSLLRTPAFTQLRTEQQLGYIVWSGFDRRDQIGGLTVGIQSNVAPPPVLLERIDAFLAGYAETLEAMDDSDFETVKAGLIANLQEAPTDLYDKTGDLSRDLSLGVTTFDRKAQLVALLQPLKRTEILAFMREEVLGDDGRLVVRALGLTHADQPMEPGCQDTACVAEKMPELFERAR
jgi:secreted Zn-dependent insulinase-like peptidase